MKPNDKDNEAIHRNSTINRLTDLIALGVAINNHTISTDRILEYVAKRTQVAFRRGYWKATQDLREGRTDTG